MLGNLTNERNSVRLNANAQWKLGSVSKTRVKVVVPHSKIRPALGSVVICIPQCSPCLRGDEMLRKNSPLRHGEHGEEKALSKIRSLLSIVVPRSFSSWKKGSDHELACTHWFLFCCRPSQRIVCFRAGR